MAGHGTIILISEAQGDCKVYVSNNGGVSEYAVGSTQTVINQTGESLAQGDVVLLDWDPDQGKLIAGSRGQKARGNVLEGGTLFAVTDPGDTDLEGEVSISGEYGENQGWGGSEEVYCSNIENQASYLSE